MIKNKTNLKWIISISSVVTIGVIVSVCVVSANTRCLDIPNKYCLNKVERTYNAKKVAISDDYSKAIKDFSTKYVLNVTSSKVQNEVFSPISIVSCYSMLLEGAKEETSNELRKALCFDDTFDIKSETQKMLNNTFIKTKDTNLNVNQSIWIDNAYSSSVKKDYLSKLEDYYYAEAFQDDLDGDNAKELLTKYINKNTNNFLNIKKEDFANYGGVLWLVNTIYLKSKWAEDFSNIKYDFKNNDGITNTKDFIKANIPDSGVYKSQNSTTFSAYFKDGLKANFMLPNLDVNFNDFVKNSSNWDELFNYKKLNFEQGNVTFRMPKIEIKCNYDLKKEFIKIGVNKIFDSDESNLKGIIDSTFENLYVDNSMHKAGIKFDKDGVEAAAVTTIETKVTSTGGLGKEIEFNLNRPFIYSITDVNEMPLFVGVVTNV